MDYRFTMTPRLIAIAVIGFISLMALLFVLGFQLGLQWGADEARQHAAANSPSQLSLPVATALPASPTLGTPIPPMTTTVPGLAPAGSLMPLPAANPPPTLGRPN